MGFMAGFGSAFASSFEKQNDRNFQQQEDDFKYQMQAALLRQQQLLELDRGNAKAMMQAKNIETTLHLPAGSWQALYYPLQAGTPYESVVNQALGTNFSVSSTSGGPTAATGPDAPAAPDASLTSGAKSAVDTQMTQANMTPPTTGGLFSSDPQNTSGGSTPDASTGDSSGMPTPNQGANPVPPPQDPNSPLTAQGNIPIPAMRPDQPAAPPQAPAAPQAPQASAPAPQVANPVPPVPGTPQAADQAMSTPPAGQPSGAPTATPRPQPGMVAPADSMAPAQTGLNTPPQANTPPPIPQGDGGPVPQQSVPPQAPAPQPTPQTHPTANPAGIPMPNMGQGKWAGLNPGSKQNADRVARNMGGQAEYDKDMNANLLTGTPIAGMDGHQVTMTPRGYMQAAQVNSLNDALAFQAGAYGPTGNAKDRAIADQKVALYRQEEYTKAKMIAIQNGTYQPPSRAAVVDAHGQAVPGQFAYPQMDQSGTDIASDKQGEIWTNPTTRQRVPMGQLHVFNPGMEKDLADSQKAMAPIQAGYNEDKNLTLGMIRTAANMQQIAQAYPAAMGSSGDIAQLVNNAKREGFNIASLIHPGLDPEAPGSLKVDDTTLGGIESYEKKVYSKFTSITDPIKKTALAASLLDAQSIRLAYMQAKSMNETAGTGGQRVSQAQFEGLYKAIRSGEQSEGLGMSNADFIMEKYNSLKDKENQMAGPGSPNAAFKQRYNIDSPLTYGSSIDDDIAKDPQVAKAFDFFQNLQGNNSLTGKPMDPNGNAGGVIGNVIDQGKQILNQGKTGPTVTPHASQLPPDIPPGAVIIGRTPQGQKIYSSDGGKTKYLSSQE